MSKEAPPPYNYPQEMPMPQPGYNMPPPAAQPPIIHAPPPQPHVTNVTVHTQPVHGGTCPVCHHGRFEGAFTLCGWLCCIFCFPCGIICCLCMRKKKCNHCGFTTS